MAPPIPYILSILSEKGASTITALFPLTLPSPSRRGCDFVLVPKWNSDYAAQSPPLKGVARSAGGCWVPRARPGTLLTAMGAALRGALHPP